MVLWRRWPPRSSLWRPQCPKLLSTAWDGPESHLLISSPEWDPSYHLLPGPGARSDETQPLGQIPCYDLCLLGQVPLRNGSRNWSWDGDGSQALVPVAHFGQIMEFPCLAHHLQLCQLARTGAPQGFPRAAAPVGVFSRGTTRISGSLSCGAAFEGL